MRLAAVYAVKALGLRGYNSAGGAQSLLCRCYSLQWSSLHSHIAGASLSADSAAGARAAAVAAALCVAVQGRAGA